MGGSNVPVADDEPRGGNGAGKQSVIGTGLRVVGEIESAGNVRIEGHVQGNVSARTLAVGDGGRLDGNVDAEIAQIDGTVNGRVRAGTVVLGATAHLMGDIVQRSLAIELGAQFDGRVKSMDAKKKTAGKTSEAAPQSGADSPKAKSATG